MRKTNRKKRKIGRNDQCWCGSGKKYKHCHLDRERQEPVAAWEAESKLRKAFSAKTCMVPINWRHECTNQISKAHTVPKSGSLEKIAQAGHVYSFRPSFKNLDKDEGFIVPELHGINHASTFTGFCSKHDNAIFAPLEKAFFSGTPEQCFLLGYRAVVRENYTKLAAVSLSKVRREADRGKPIQHQIAIQALTNPYELGLSAGLADIEHYKSIYDDVLINRRFDDVRAYILETGNVPPVMCSGGIFPEQDFEGNNLQDMENLKLTPHLINFSSFDGGQYGAIVFTWLPESNETCLAFIQSLHRIPSDNLAGAILRFFFEFCENVHMSPEWWEGLPSSTRYAIIKRMSISTYPIIDRVSDCLKDDGIQFPSWTFVIRKTLGFEL
jgi:hypothetical protein